VLISSTDGKGSWCGSVPFLEWNDCDTLSKKIGFIAGNGINFVATNVGNAFVAANRSYHTHFPSRINQGFLYEPSLLQKISKSFNEALCVVGYRLKNVGYRLKNMISNLYCLAIGLNSLRTLNEWTIKPVCKRTLSPVGRKICNLFKSLVSNGYKALKKIVNLTFVSLNKYVLSPILNKIVRLFQHIALNYAEPVLKPVWNSVVVPFGTNVVKPVVSSIGDFIYALVSGTAR
jgi:hypothetical protein